MKLLVVPSIIALFFLTGCISEPKPSAPITITQVYHTDDAFAAMRSDGRVISWGPAPFSVRASENENLLRNVEKIYTSRSTFAAVRKDKTLFTWGAERDEYARDENVASVTSNEAAFVALHGDGTIKVWGSRVSGGYLPPSKTPTNVRKVFSGPNSFAAVLDDGTVYSWGTVSEGSFVMDGDRKLKDVKDIVATKNAFAALKNDGTVVTWGRPASGGDASHLHLHKVHKIYSNDYAFAALMEDGSVKTWGREENGGCSDYVALSQVTKIYSTRAAFAALKHDGSVTVWGNEKAGGSSKFVDIGAGVKEVYSADMAFAALKDDGSVVFWGDGFFVYPHDSEPRSTKQRDISGIHKNYIAAGASAVFSTRDSFAVLKNDGSVETLGAEVYKGDGLSGGVVRIYSNNGAFVAFKSNNEPMAWGRSGYGSNVYAVMHLLNPSAYRDEEQ